MKIGTYVVLVLGTLPFVLYAVTFWTLSYVLIENLPAWGLLSAAERGAYGAFSAWLLYPVVFGGSVVVASAKLKAGTTGRAFCVCWIPIAYLLLIAGFVSVWTTLYPM